MKTAGVSISGLVQGIGFRPFVYRLAVARGLKGYVKNLGDAGVDIEVTGKEEDIKAFLTDLKHKKPPLALYTKIIVQWLDADVEHGEFVIDDSDLGKREVKLSIIPPDIAVCPNCLKELFDPKDRHHNYPFTCCAICGPRLTTITDIPYDRSRTTMVEFPLCRECSREFYDPLDRRFNAQTICCPECGPRMTLHHPDGAVVSGGDPIREAAKILEEGSIVAVKGIGGFHLAVGAVEDGPMLLLRERRRKPNKPFAVMSLGVEEVEKFGSLSDDERELLSSYMRPIVAVKKLEPSPLSQYVSPGLHTVGVMLPYSGIHYTLLRSVSWPALIMTSANYPGEPMVVSNDEALKRLENVADYFLLHDREIYARCDDSVVRFVDGGPVFLRRSRGYVPMPVHLPFESAAAVAAVGPEESSTASLLKGDKCYLTQHLGDVESPESLSFLEGSLRHLVKMFRGGKLDAVACDLHPSFLSRIVAEKLVEESDSQLVEVQHHHAHLASLLADNGVAPGEKVVGVTCDGYGYGADGQAWGGEILVGDYSDFERVGHLEPQPMPGGDLCAVRYGRMLQGILYGEMPRDALEKLLLEQCLNGFSKGAAEVDTVFKQLEGGVFTPTTTSAGRLLDAVSCLLGISRSRTYHGEGALKLEAAATFGKSNTVDIPVEMEKRNGVNVLKTSQMVRRISELTRNHGKESLAKAFHTALARGLAEMALKAAKCSGLMVVGFSGGVAYNDLITRTIRERIEQEGLTFLRHRQAPCGDGGVSLGQAAVASFRLHRRL